MTNAEQNTAYLNLAQLELITGLTDRTLRSYLRQGLLPLVQQYFHKP